MFTFSIIPSSGNTFVDTFSAITNLSASDVKINWGDDSFFTTNLTHSYTVPGIYTATIESCSGNMYYTLTASKYPLPQINISSTTQIISAGCNHCFNVSLTSDDLKSTRTLLFDVLSSNSFENVQPEFYSHLIPSTYFLDSSGNKIKEYEMSLSPISANNSVIGYSGSAEFCFHDDLPGNPRIKISMDSTNSCFDLYKVDQTNTRTVYELTPLSSYCIGYASDTGLTGTNQTSAYDIFRNNNINHLILGGDNSYDDARVDRLTENLKVFNPYLSANDPELHTLVVGNHDRDAGYLSAYNTLFPNFSAYEYKTIASGGIDLFKLDSGLNSLLINKQFDGISVGSKQYNYFVKSVSDSHSKFKIVAFHHPAFASNITGNSRPEILKEMDWKFEDFGVTLVLNGHTHYTEVLEKDNVVIVNVSGTTKPLIAPTYVSPYSVFRSSTRAVALIYCYPTKFVVKIVGYDGTILYTKEKILSVEPKIYTMENLSGFSNVELEEYNGSFSVSSTGLNHNNLVFENITIKSAS